MTKPLAFGTMLLFTTQLVAPAALAQTGGSASGAQSAPATAAPPQDRQPDDQDVEVSTPGYDPQSAGDIVVVGQNIPNQVRATPQVLSVLSSEDIARTGEGDIAGALGRVTGLSVVNSGFVFVRGLGDRYSLAMLNGSPLPSPEPLRRTVPLDIFPTEIVGSALVQKSYSVNYPGEFGGGVINLTTRAIPDKTFLKIGGSIAADTESTSELGYVYDGGGHDWNGFDDGTRDVPSFIRDIGLGNGSSAYVTTDQIAQMDNRKTTVLQANYHLPANLGADLSFGTSTDIGTGRLGVIAAGNFSNTFRTRETTQQDTTTPNGQKRNDFDAVITDNRIVANGLLGLGAEFGEQRIRWTNVYIHDTLKQGRLATATNYTNSSGDPIVQQNSNWYERQLFESQATGEFKIGNLGIDLRGAYANTKRKAPYEREFQYKYDPDNGVYVNALNQTAFSYATVNFSDLNEDLWSGQADLSYKLPMARPTTLSAGYYYSDTDRDSTRFSFEYRYANGGSLPTPYSYLRPDQLLSDTVLYDSCDVPADGCVTLINTSASQGAARYRGGLTIHAGYGQIESELADGLRATIGVRYEDATESVNTGDDVFVGTKLDLDHWLPAATITWNFAPDMQVRIAGSKTIARPQFRELAPQFYQDFDSTRSFIGNPYLTDTVLKNAEARFEWYFADQQSLSIAGFYKHLDNPIETVSFFTSQDNPVLTGFSYAPAAELYGAEVEATKYFPLDWVGSGFGTRRAFIIANYTYTQSKLKVGDEDVPYPLAGSATQMIPANTLYVDGAPLTGQSDHIVNVQIGVEDTESLSQITLLANYASKRITARGAQYNGSDTLPDTYEYPGVQLDLVARQGFTVAGTAFELKLEGRNLLHTDYKEYQDFGENGRVYFNRYDRGRIYSLGLSAKF
ncbi:TonB-dependent receptor [Stakelama sp. CBK3Z-3]|uniref:TonB-dependent receptor n=1 Tax=Stakelama flava TaxID=2860338 RepID=A0ABS6XH71_9SPHN|nr:TonB-dependent receptor [Stakelama flava]MBW4329559.1 TonB-dependent receptor [Stakelama flava]